MGIIGRRTINFTVELYQNDGCCANAMMRGRRRRDFFGNTRPATPAIIQPRFNVWMNE
jgi:hypothetical protein